jgi:hypothetical protein
MMDVMDEERQAYEECLEDCRKLYEAGDKSQILSCLHLCLEVGYWPPDWLREAFDEAFHEVSQYRVKSWDDVFGRQLEKGKHLATQRRNNEIKYKVYDRVKELHKAGEAIDTELFHKVGVEFGVCTTTASDLYYADIRNHTLVSFVDLEQ